MKVALLVIGNGRSYLHTTVPAALHHINHPLSARLMVDDSGDMDWGRALEARYPDFKIYHSVAPLGMAGAVQQGFGLTLMFDPDYVIWIEDDMELIRTLPIADAITVLEAHSNIAQMCFRRDPYDPSEFPCQLDAICHKATFVESYPAYTTHDYLFSLNPCIIPRRVLELGWPSGPIGTGNEDGMTQKLLDQGYVFGSWGHPADGQSWARHIGELRSPTYAL